MYRMLIVSNSPKAEDMFSAITGWETMGFKTPRLRKTFDEAVDCMQKHHIDAIGIDEGFEKLNDWLDENQPQIPIFKLFNNQDEQIKEIRQVEILLNQIHTDDSNDDYDEENNFSMARDRWMKYLISRLAITKNEVLKQQRLYRCCDDPQKPCYFAKIGIPEDDMFITERWHYGSERLATALRNFFGRQYNGLNIHIAVVSPEEIRVALVPKYCQTGQSMSIEDVKAYIEETIEQVHQYLGVSMTLKELRTLGGLVDFAAESDWSDAE